VTALYRVTNDEILAEMLDRREEFAGTRGGSLESLGGGKGSTEALANGLKRMREGTYVQGEDGGLEAIVKRFTRPVFFIRGTGFVPPADSARFAQGESEVISRKLSSAADYLTATIPSVGRVELTNHRFDWVGTGWMVAQEVAVTNRHVAEVFAAQTGDDFTFRKADGDRWVKASLDLHREYQCGDASVLKIREVLWMEPDGGPDVALVRVDAEDDQGNAAPYPIPLMTKAEIDASVGDWIGVIGYPAQSAYNDLHDQQRIFDGVYGVKRLAPGTVMAVSPDGELTHDATTLGGNSGSVVLNLASGKAVGLHFGGIEGDRNSAVQAHVIRTMLDAHL
jgi:hypothetical protein